MAPAAGCVGLRLPKLMSLSLRCLDDIPLMSALLFDVCWLMSTPLPCIDVFSLARDASHSWPLHEADATPR